MFKTLNSDALTGIKYIIITNNDVLTYETKTDVKKDLRVEWFKPLVLKVLEVKEIDIMKLTKKVTK